VCPPSTFAQSAPNRGALLYSIGHSTRSEDEFVGLLRSYRIGALADVRTIPKSRRHPHFGSDRLCDRLSREGIEYRHMPALGGLRRPRPDSPNIAWSNEAFRGYADYMGTEPFESGLETLLDWAAARVVAFMCAEAVWWRCHRRIVADYLLAAGEAVLHILGPGKIEEARMTSAARPAPDGGLVYPSAEGAS
jgi:uncharacterized protein (DUF488 family)